jgi:hypothetical protein
LETLDDNRRPAPVGVTRKRCGTCKRFAKLLPGDTECMACAGMLPLPITVTDVQVWGGRR